MLELILLVTIAVAFGLWLVVGGTGMSRSWKQRWPAISEEEFISKCTPGVNPERALKVRRVISEQLGIPYEHIHPEQRFVEDLHCD